MLVMWIAVLGTVVAFAALTLVWSALTMAGRCDEAMGYDEGRAGPAA